MNKRNSIIGIIIAVVVVIAVFVGVNSAKGSDQTNTASDSNQKVITVGTEGTYAPFSYFNEKNELVGFDVDVAKAVFSKLGYQVKFEDAPWDSMIASFNAKKTDVVFNQVGITPERQKNFLFTTPYSYSRAALIVAKDNNEIKDFDDLKGKKSAQSLTSNYGARAESYGATLVSTDGFSKAADLVSQGRADATLNSDVSFYDYLKQNPNANIKIVNQVKDATPSAAMFQKGNEDLVKQVDEVLAQLKQDGTLKSISEKYFNKDITQE
ncbi:amino acid ABC transporter substrate-binding protein [Holzapfeliella sp. JNUCC 72]